jgi:hypothetical protein
MQPLSQAKTKHPRAAKLSVGPLLALLYQTGVATYWVLVAVRVPAAVFGRYNRRFFSCLLVATVCKTIKLTVNRLQPSGYFMYRQV